MAITKDYRTYRILAIGWMAVIFILSSIPGPIGPSLFSAQDKIAHALVFGFLGFLFSRSFKPSEERPTFMRVLLVTLMVAAYGGLDETHQLFVTGREASLTDVLADAAGGFVAGIVFRNRQLKSF